MKKMLEGSSLGAQAAADCCQAQERDAEWQNLQFKMRLLDVKNSSHWILRAASTSDFDCQYFRALFKKNTQVWMQHKQRQSCDWPTWHRGRRAAGTSRPCRCSWGCSWWCWRSGRATDKWGPLAPLCPGGQSAPLIPCRLQPSLQEGDDDTGYISEFKSLPENHQKKHCNKITLDEPALTHPQSPKQTRPSERVGPTWSRDGRTAPAQPPGCSRHTAAPSGCLSVETQAAQLRREQQAANRKSPSHWEPRSYMSLACSCVSM